jgi:hypothetical protein
MILAFFWANTKWVHWLGEVHYWPETLGNLFIDMCEVEHQKINFTNVSNVSAKSS